MNEYFFILGNTPNLSIAEINAVLAGKKISYKEIFRNDKILEIAAEIQADQAALLLDLLGGTVKIGQVLKTASSEVLPEALEEILRKEAGYGKIDFALSLYGEESKDLNFYRLTRDLKNTLREENISVKYVLPRPGEQEVSSVVIKKQKLLELEILPTKNGTVVAKTLSVQDFEDWGKRDYGRPETEGHIGMLPPKVARMMVNLAAVGEGETLLDPFCGVGTIVSEALVLGHKVVAGDISLAQVERTRANIEWLQRNFKFEISNFKLLQVDARKISETVRGPLDAIVTEPDLGPNTGNLIPGQKREDLEKLYLDALSDWKKVLVPGGRVVIALPGFGLDRQLVKNVIDKAIAMGYSLQAGPIEYARAQAKIIRNICLFKI